MAGRPAAVVVEGACKHYGRKNKPDYKPVLENLDMTVDSGIIYGLLGPSGCGKTTLLSCIVGRRTLNSGNIWVLGGRPGEKGSGVPGPRVGYMPQDIALVGEFTVRDAIYYFGRIYGMKLSRLSERFDFLSSLLELPDGGRFVKSLSGGQQRRVSLAAALVHEPELLILDEPTVGLDPVLRERLENETQKYTRAKCTLIMSPNIGMLRDGQLLAEDSPEEILRRFEVDTLEEAFLQLALRQHQLPRRRSTLMGSPDVIPESRIPAVDSRYQSSESFNMVTGSTEVFTKKQSSIDSNSKSRTKSRYKAVFIKSLQQFARHPGGLIFSILFPIIQVVAFFSAVGHDPKDLNVAVVNDEAAYSPFSPHPVVLALQGVRYNTTEEAKNAVVKGQLYAALYFRYNFSEMLEQRLREGSVDDDVVEGSTVSVWLDMTNHQISYFLKSQFLKAYESFTRRTMRACERNENLVQIPVHFMEPVYGDTKNEMVSYMAPGVMITIIFFLPAIVTSNLLITDRLEGVWERSAVAGVKAKEMLYVHIVLQTAVILLQTLEMTALAYGGYGLYTRGSLITCGILIFLQGISGMCYGFFLSIYCNSYVLAFFVSTGSFYPMILLCGILWPLEAMSTVLRAIALTLPFTIPSKSLRDIMEKGHGITDSSVYTGFIVTLVWIGFMLALCLLRLKLKKS
ncbi:ABC transporter G family member 20-like [Hyposmocoma kahamanoa]|uniref:ABC transporter G family member 20-like n=1 Tax=Hyposmocoma kahamanoa TaxID=1477025 RepID=UPI000E6DA060|nr:ABC transporter G family member 20-like [Hyposmocoma kahamanoa]